MAAAFAALSEDAAAPTGLRAEIAAAHRRSEPDCLARLVALAEATPAEAPRIAEVAADLIRRLRAKPRAGGVEGLIHEYSLSSQEGVALMCLAEALLRVPDAATRDALIRDKLAPGDWRAHVGRSPSLFVNAATWGLVVTGRLVTTSSEQTLGAALSRLIARSGEPIIRAGVDVAMRMMGEQFVSGRNIEEALRAARLREARGFSFSYDMLGEAAATAEDAARYYADYEGAIRAIGAAANGRGVYEGPGISIKLSALHPRYCRAQRARVMNELLPRVRTLAALAKSYDIGFNIDAEEADRLEISLDLLEALAGDPALSGWNGLGFVVQAYGRRAPAVLDWLIDLARRTRRRIMVRLVKGAYWDTEIKRAQLEGLSDFPVYTRKLHTDVAYLACARKMLGARDALFPQFATHNAQTLASVLAFAGADYARDEYEFQCLHGMGEPLYEEVVARLSRPARVYAPVGSHETLLAYLVRRLLENGANTSFVNRIADPAVSIEDLTADPVALAREIAPLGAPHPRISSPDALYSPSRVNSRGLDLSSEAELARLAAELEATAGATGEGRAVANPADRDDVVGHVAFATPQDIDAAIAVAVASNWGQTPPPARAETLRRAADQIEAAHARLIGVLVREAGKSYAAAVAEVREAVDFLRYYADEAVRLFGPSAPAPLGPVACISPWNFPLAIFSGQVAAALAAGNAVLAKPAEETPLVAAAAVTMMHEAGVPAHALQLMAGEGDVGAALVADARVRGVMFTGSTAVAKLIDRSLAGRLTPTGQPVPLIAETGGLNAMVVDSSALAEQVVADVVASAFDSAGQRCSALRILCVQEDVASRLLAMLKGAMAELSVGDPRKLSTDVGPVITAEARDAMLAYIEEMRTKGFTVTQTPLGPDTKRGAFVAPTLIEVGGVRDVTREVFGPVLHMLRFARGDLDALVDAIDATGYALTFGLHTRIDETIARVVERVSAGNIYVNRNIIGATVGVQPFGGSGLSGTGPKAGGPLYLARLVAEPPTPQDLEGAPEALAPLAAYADWLRDVGAPAEAERAVALAALSPLGARRELQGPVGERNVYALRRRGRIAAAAETVAGLRLQLASIFAAGGDAVVPAALAGQALGDLPGSLAHRVELSEAPLDAPRLAGALVEGAGEVVAQAARRLAARPGAIVRMQARASAALADGQDYRIADLLEERSISTNVAAAGGNASLMAIG